MPHVSIHYRIYLGAAHHRRPRNPQPWVEPYPSSEVDVATGGVITPFAPPSLPYTPAGGATVEPAFVFWGLTDGTGGRTQTSQALTETVGTSPLTLVAWYYLPSGGGGGVGGGSAILIDAYSVQQGGFVDDDFVTVTSDGSLTNSANVDGVVPTSVDETIQAFGSIPTGESFENWVVSPGGATAMGDVLSAPAGSGGLAIATYKRTQITVPRFRPPIEGVFIVYGVANDAPGLVIPIGGGPPIPIGPWGPYIERLITAVSMEAGSSRLSKGGAARIREAMAAEIAEVAEEIANVAKKGFR